MNNKIKNADISKLKELGDNNLIEDCLFLGDNIKVGSNCSLKNIVVHDNSVLSDCYLEDVSLGENCLISPYVFIKNNVTIGNNCRINSFVNICNSILRDNIIVDIGSNIINAIIGKNTHISSHVTFSYFNGKSKNISIIGDNCFLGTQVNIISPIKLASNTYVCSSTTVTIDTNVGDFVYGRINDQVIDKYSYFIDNN